MLQQWRIMPRKIITFKHSGYHVNAQPAVTLKNPFWPENIYVFRTILRIKIYYLYINRYDS
jgi:hypothetical protein